MTRPLIATTWSAYMGGAEDTRASVAVDYIRDIFKPKDRVALVLLDKRCGAVIQRLSTAERIVASDVQAWLHAQNAQRYDVYVSMNALKADATGRTKSDVDAIRHIYLDFDDNGTASVEALLRREDLPEPNYLLNTSPDKWQVVWRVEGFQKDQAEALQRGLACQMGADPAATDCARVLRLPGFYNHKYERPHHVRIEARGKEVFRPDQFVVPTDERGSEMVRRNRVRIADGRGLTQSERDWAFAKRSLARGDSPEMVVAAIASYRRYDKVNPHQYAALTVRKAGENLASRRGVSEPPERS